MDTFLKSVSVLSAAVLLSLTSCIPDIGHGYTAYSLQAPWHGKVDDTRFCCHSTSDRLFFSFEVSDTTLVLLDDFGGETDVNLEDRVEVFFSADKSLENGYYCAEIDAAGRIMDYRAEFFRSFDFDWDFTDMTAEGMLIPGGYRVGGSVSREALMGLGINLDKGFWIGAFRGDCLGGDNFEWYSLIPHHVEQPDFHRPGVLMRVKATPCPEKHGVVVYPDDIKSLGLTEWERRIDLSGMDVIGLHAATSNDPIDTLETFVRSKIGRDFLAMCARKGVDVEYELHAIEYLLPRELYGQHPEYYRMDEEGRRCRDYNMCFACEDAVEAMRPQLEKLLEWARPTTHRYYFWADDKQDKFCNCPLCAAYSPSEQILLYENRLLKLLREYDPEATLAHLAYQQTLDAPRKVRADEGVFLEYAPIKRDYSRPLSAEQISALHDNLMAFPDYTQHILEYWLDESMFCHWKKPCPVRLPVTREQIERDIDSYRSCGAVDFTCFAAWLNARYEEIYGSADGIFSSYGDAFSVK